MTKFEQALKIFNENTSIARKDFIARLVAELGMTAAGASTYHNKCKNHSGPVAAKAVVEQPKVEVAKTATPKKIAKQDFDYGNDVPLFIKRGWERWAAASKAA